MLGSGDVIINRAQSPLQGTQMEQITLAWILMYQVLLEDT